MKRRDILKLAAAAPVAAWAFSPGIALAQAEGLSEGNRFSRDALVAAAKALAAAPYVAPESTLPDTLRDLDANAYAKIRFRPEMAIWSAERRGFAIELLHRGFVFATQVELFTVEDGRVLRIPYNPSLFDFGDLKPPQPTDVTGFSGFRLSSQSSEPARFDPIAVFQGATFFRAIGTRQTFGQTARGLALNVADAAGEEFPLFRAFWIERPEADAKTLSVHALLDSDAVTGAYTLTMTPGDMTTIEVDCTLFPREDIQHVGVAPANAMYLFGVNDDAGMDDVRLAAHDASGLQMLNGGGEWIWRPLQNPATLQISAFVDKDPRAFGLLQRSRNPETFEDAQHNYERMPSLWIEPLEPWGPGTIQLIEIPTDNDVNDNVVAYWRPEAALTAGGQYRFRYRMSWCWSPSRTPPLAIAQATRSGDGGQRRRIFAIDFVGDIFRDPGRASALKTLVTASSGKVLWSALTPLPERGMGRLAFALDPGSQAVSELRAQVLENETPVSETWLYRWIA